MPIGPRRRGVAAHSEADDMEDSLLRAMDEDPRLASGAGVPRADNVLDFIQMTGLTTGRVPAAPPAEYPDDPISFFEYGVRDVDGSGDPAETAYPELDSAAFHIDASERIPEVSQSVAELRQIIADLAAMESDLEMQPPAPEPESSPAPSPRAAALVERAPAPASAPALEPIAAVEADSEPEVEIDVDVDEITDELSDPSPAAVPDVDVDLADYESPMKSPAGLAAARELLMELAKANDAAERAELKFARPAPPAREAGLANGLPPLSPAYEDDAEEPTTHLGLVRRRRDPSSHRWFARALVVALAVGTGIGAFMMYERAVQPPRAAFDAAQSLIDKARFEDASSAFLDFTKRYPGNPRRAEALYMAGFALQLVPEDPAPRAKEAYTESIELLRGFIEEYPAHEKSPRAETLMGVLFYKTGRYLEAINILGDPERRLRDPGGYLTALRTLGRSYAALNQMDNARSSFMRAGALESNMAPDLDYAELAGMYTQLAERSGEPAQRRHLFQQAVEQWDFALQVPGLLKTRKDDMKLLRDVAASKVENEFGAGTPGQTPTSRVRGLTRGTQEGGSASPVL